MSLPKVVYNTGDYYWYTPWIYTHLASELMGGIDLDPASDEFGNSRIGAAQYYGIKDNSLNLDWHGRVWLNPPYSTKLVRSFTSKLHAEYKKNNVRQAVLLVNNSTETEWYQECVKYAMAMCFPKGRIKFEKPDGARNSSPLQGQTIFYYGPSLKAVDFMSMFGPLGFAVWTP